MRRGWPLSARLTLWYALLLLASVVAFGALLYEEVLHQTQAEAGAILRAAATQISSQVDVQGDSVGVPLDLQGLPRGTYFALYSPSGRLLLLRAPRGVGPPPAAAEAEPGLWAYAADGQRWLALRAPLTGESGPAGYTVVFRSVTADQEGARRLLWMMATALPLLLLVSGVGGYLLSQSALKPIDRVIRTTQAIWAGNLSQRIGPAATADEIGRLVATLDEMLDRLEKAFVAQRRFTSDASHELRTPVAIIRAQAEAALEDESGQTARAALAVIHREAERMTAMLAHMLELVRADAGPRRDAREPVNLRDLIDATLAAFQPLAEERGIRLVARHGQEPVVMAVDQLSLTQSLVNLVQNALDFTPAGGEVCVSWDLCPRQQGVRIAVQDTGVGIAPEDVPRIFDRFYRGRRGRPHGEPASGAGLGLAIVRQAVETMGGRVEVTSVAGQGSTFVLWLPWSPPPPRGGSATAT